MRCSKSNEHKVGVATNAGHDRESFDKDLLPVVERKMACRAGFVWQQDGVMPLTREDKQEEAEQVKGREGGDTGGSSPPPSLRGLRTLRGLSLSIGLM